MIYGKGNDLPGGDVPLPRMKAEKNHSKGKSRNGLSYGRKDTLCGMSAASDKTQ